MKLQYKAVARDGTVSKGVIEARDNNEAAGILRVRGLLPVSIAPVKQDNLGKYLPFLNRITQKEVVFFTRQLSSMLASGLTLFQALNVLREQTQNLKMREVVQGITTDIQGGNSFSSAIGKHPDIFTPVYISLIKTAETSGLLDKVLLRLAENLEKQQKLKGTIKGALTYPVIVVIGMIVVMTIMMVVVIPQISTLYDSIGIELPFTTKVVVGMSNFMINYWIFIIIFFVAAFIGFKRWRATPSGKVVMDTLVLKVPVFGNLIRLTILTEFSRTFGLLVGSGALVVQSLQQSADVAGNSLYKEAIVDISKRVEKGVTVGDAMGAYALFPPLMVQMVKVGEETGKLDESLLKTSEYFESEVDTMVKTLTTALEPFIMIMLGIGVAFLIISIITPIYSLISSIS